MSRFIVAWRLMERMVKPVIFLLLGIMLVTDWIWGLAWWGKVFSLILWCECAVWAWHKHGRKPELRLPLFLSLGGWLTLVLAIHYYRSIGWVVALVCLATNHLSHKDAKGDSTSAE